MVFMVRIIFQKSLERSAQNVTKPLRTQNWKQMALNIIQNALYVKAVKSHWREATRRKMVSPIVLTVMKNDLQKIVLNARKRFCPITWLQMDYTIILHVLYAIIVRNNLVNFHTKLKKDRPIVSQIGIICSQRNVNIAKSP